MKIQRGRILVVTKSGCVYCDRAKAWLESKDAAYTETDWDSLTESEQTELKRRVLTECDRLTFPQIFIGEVRVDGGCGGLTKMTDDELDETMLSQGIF